MAFTGNPDIVHAVTVGDKLGANDNSVLTELRIPTLRIALSERKIYLYSQGDYEALAAEVRATDWEKTFERIWMRNGILLKRNIANG